MTVYTQLVELAKRILIVYGVFVLVISLPWTLYSSLGMFATYIQSTGPTPGREAFRVFRNAMEDGPGALLPGIHVIFDLLEPVFFAVFGSLYPVHGMLLIVFVTWLFYVVYFAL